MKISIDGLVKSHEFNYRWLSKKVHIQDVVFFQERGHTCSMQKCLKKYCNAVDGTFYDAISIYIGKKSDLKFYDDKQATDIWQRK